MTRWGVHCRALIMATLGSLVLCGAVRADDAVMEEYAVKAALVYNFARFTEWPAGTFVDDQEPLRVVIYGDESLAKAFAGIDGKSVGGRSIEIAQTERPGDVAGCHLLFLAKTEREQWPQVMAALAADPVLTVGEMNGFLETGGIMNLHLDENRIRFQVNLDRARTRELMISSRILKLASSVIDERREES